MLYLKRFMRFFLLYVGIAGVVLVLPPQPVLQDNTLAGIIVGAFLAGYVIMSE